MKRYIKPTTTTVELGCKSSICEEMFFGGSVNNTGGAAKSTDLDLDAWDEEEDEADYAYGYTGWE